MGNFNQFRPGNLCSSFKLKKLVKKPTRGSNILDQFYSTLSDYYDEAQILPPLGFSDHSSILLKPSSRQTPHLSCTSDQRCVCNTHNRCKLLSSFQAFNWSLMYHLDTCKDQLKDFQRVVTGAMNRSLPMRLVILRISPGLPLRSKTQSRNVNAPGQKATNTPIKYIVTR